MKDIRIYRKRLFFILFVLLSVPFTIFSAPPVGDVTVKTWPDDRKSAFSFTFDDGFISHYDNVRPILNSFGFKATFYVISNSLTDNLPGNWRYGTWNQFRIIANEGHEIGSHTVEHPDLTSLPIGNITTPHTLKYELFDSQSSIEEKIPEYPCISLAYPFTAYNSNVISNAKTYYLSGRAGGLTPMDTSLSETEWFSLSSRVNNFNLPRNSINDDLDELNTFKNYVQSGINIKGWTTLMGHEVFPFSQIQWALQQGAYYPISNEWLISLCEWAKQKSDNKELWIETVGNITRYMREKDEFNYNLISQSENLIQLNATDLLDNDIFNYPLTVDITVPSSWTKAVLKQGSRVDTLIVSGSGINKTVQGKIIPDGGIVSIEKVVVPGNYTLGGTITYSNSSSSPLGNVLVSLTGPSNFSQTRTTTSNGTYSFTGLNPGNYVIGFSKIDDFREVDAIDALMSVRYFASLQSLDNMQLLSADVNNDNNINSTDALLIVRRFAGLISSFTKPDWLFIPATTNILIDANKTVNASAIITGDVNKSYIP